jgi:hypothetical protein
VDLTDLSVAGSALRRRESLVGLIAPADITIAVTLAAVFAGSLAAGLAGFAFSAIAGALLFHWLSP